MINEAKKKKKKNAVEAICFTHLKCSNFMLTQILHIHLHVLCIQTGIHCKLCHVWVTVVLLCVVECIWILFAHFSL